MRNKLLISTAAACFALSMGVAVAQGPGGQGAKPESGSGTPGGAGSMSQSGPGGASGVSQGSPGAGEKRGQAGGAQTSAPSEKSGQATQPSGQSPPSAQSQTRGDKDQRNQAQSPSTTQHNQSSQTQPADRGANPRGTNEQVQSKESVQQGGQRNQATDSARGGAAGSASTSSTAGGGSNVTLNTEQKTKIRETVINSSSAPRATNVNIALNVGTTVPSSVRIAPVPSVLVEINPGWRSYEYFVVNDEIIIVDPRTHRIVAILPV
jgi:hypothetical protein